MFPGIYKALQKVIEEEKKPTGFTCPHCKKEHKKLLWIEDRGWACANCKERSTR